ncbi:response regulator [Actinophytocola algeriensis]|uniref:DNA-binding NarL/FixJ family response regulator n=1 Tax=Actinophytocola algeriensis TaxID=1768010 RepID=A0A7W7Q7P0_9PSEU|nr:response regulator transcription factor [Actinophytocola algeriensis]MBB4908141.1 DNA-binding NarL/FixJ family response regulator [Actinophytocola algeriensis]MBE1480171.1 DNA-binding NarL/FixJ family response regulator [Actinophytocola algeriensis]
MIRVLVVDDHPVVRQGLRTFLDLQDDITVVGESADGASCVDDADRLRPDVILLDLRMPGADGVTALRGLRDNPARVLVVTSYTEPGAVLPAVRAGAAGYVYKDVDPPALAAAIRSVHAGHVLLHPDVARLLTEGDTHPGPAELTARERDVLAEVARGRSNREIARALSLSEKTVKTHVSSILGKLGVQDRTQAALHAVRTGLVDS